MIAYKVWQRQDFKAVIRREMMDTNTDSNGNGRWIGDAELNLYLDDWLHEIQNDFEFVWGVSTLTIGTITSTGTFTNGTTTTFSPPQLIIPISTFTPGMHRNEAVYYNGFRLSGRLLQDLEVGDPIWRGDLGNGTSAPSDSNPYVYDTPRAAVMYPDSEHILIWPCPQPPGTIPPGTNTNVFVFEYPVRLSFVTDTSTSGLPIWTQWSAKSYVCQKLYQRPGPINDAKRSQRYAAQYARAKLRIRRLWDNFMPERYRRLVPLGGQYEWNILLPPPAWDCGTNTATGADIRFNQFNLPSSLGTGPVSIPALFPFQNAQIYLNGILQADQGVDYTRVGHSVTFTAPPSPSDVIVAVVT